MVILENKANHERAHYIVCCVSRSMTRWISQEAFNSSILVLVFFFWFGEKRDSNCESPVHSPYLDPRHIMHSSY